MVKHYIEESVNIKNILLNDKNFISNISQIIRMTDKCLKTGKKILIAGNGGSAADAQHFAAEIVGKYKKERRGYPVIALTANTSILTAWSNDYEFDTLFARQIEALGSPGDVFIGLSTSGNSKNILEAIKKAKQIGLKTVCFLGNDGGILKDAADMYIIVPSENTPRIQEIYIMLLHIIAEEIEKSFA